MPRGEESTTKFKTDISELLASMKQAARSIRMANSEFKAATAGMDNWEKSADGLSAKTRQLGTILDAQKLKLSALEKQYELVTAEQGENSKGAQELIIKINNQKAAIGKTEKQLATYNGKLIDLKNEQKQAETPMSQLNNKISEQEQRLLSLKDEYKNAVAQYGKNSKEARILASDIQGLSRELGANKSKMSELDKAADDLDGSLEDVKDITEETSEGFSVMKVVLGNLVTAGIMKVAEGLRELGRTAVDIGKKAFSNYSSYQQLTGGVETLFKDSSDKVMNYANNAYDAAGMSANDYMETVTGFSAALLQGLEGDTAKAADTANKAIIDMSDNANKMGTDVTMLQSAYQGFAKGQYRLLDNLKLGYGGTASEMARLINDSGVLGDTMKVTSKNVNEVSFDQIIEAIHIMQERMDIAGTTAKEASTTIDGSVNAMKSSWENLLTGIADPSQDMGALIGSFADTVVIASKNVIPTVKNIIGGMGKFAVTMIKEVVPEIAKEITNFDSIDEAISFVSQNVFSKMQEIRSTLVEKAMEWIPQITQFGAEMLTNLGTGIKENLPDFVSYALDALDGFANMLTENLPIIIKAGISFVRSLAEGLVASMPEFIERAPEIVTKFANLINDSAPLILQAAVSLMWTLITGLIGMIPMLVENIPQIIEAFVAVWEAFNWIDLGRNAIKLLKDGILKMLSAVKTAGKTISSGLVEIIQQLPSKLFEFGKSAISNLGSAIESGLGTVKSSAIKIVSGIVDTILGLPQQMASIGGDIVRGLWNGISGMVGWMTNKVKGFADSVLGGIKKAFGIASPSKRMRDEVGRFLPEGLAEGVKRRANVAVEAMRKMANRMLPEAESIREQFGFDNDGWKPKPQGGGGSVTYNFYQTNNSPKALSRLEIYRQTRNQLNLVKG